MAAKHAPLHADVGREYKIRSKFERGSYLFRICVQNAEGKMFALAQTSDKMFGPAARAMAEALSELVTEGHQKFALEECKRIARQDQSLRQMFSL